MTLPAGSPLSGIRAVVCDLDGVVYRGPRAVPGAVEALARIREQGVTVVYATNNASRTPAAVAAHLRELGVVLDDEDVLTSSVTGARHLAGALPAGSPVLAVGGEGVPAALGAAGLVARTPAEVREGAPVDAVLQGYGAQVSAADLAEAAFAVAGGAMWVATNTDRTLPTERGVAPGNGSLVAAVRFAVDVDPQVVGKPGPMMYELAAQRLGLADDEVLGVGDRLDTDIAGARAAAMPSALVLTGVHDTADAAAAPPQQRPDRLLSDLSGLLQPYPQVMSEGSAVRCADATAGHDGSRLRVRGAGIDAARAALALAWALVDDGTLTPDDARTQVRDALTTTAHLVDPPSRQERA